MYWEEHIDLLKRKFGLKDFKVPFNDWKEILKRIESNFIRNEPEISDLQIGLIL